jgi:SH3-like domain-containing protein
MLWMYEQPDPASTKVAGLAATDNGLILQHCAGDWCYVLRGEQKGWVAKANIGAVCH